MNNRNLVIGGIVLLVLIGGAVLLTRGQSTTSVDVNSVPTVSMEQPTPASSENLDSTDSGEMSGVKEIMVESNGLSFTPTEIRVKAGDKVRLTYKNNMGTHDFTLDEFNVKTKVLNAGQSETVEFTADKAGTYEFYCSVMDHRKQGMKGAFIVE